MRRQGGDCWDRSGKQILGEADCLYMFLPDDHEHRQVINPVIIYEILRFKLKTLNSYVGIL
jgi:hypothetical protein